MRNLLNDQFVLFLLQRLSCGRIPCLDSDQALIEHDPHCATVGGVPEGRGNLSVEMHPAAPHHLPFFIPGPDGSDTLMVVTGIFLVAIILWVGTLYWKLHSLPERMAHK